MKASLSLFNKKLGREKEFSRFDFTNKDYFNNLPNDIIFLVGNNIKMVKTAISLDVTNMLNVLYW